MIESDTELAKFGFAPFAEGADGRVVIRNDTFEEFKELDLRPQAQLLARATLWADGQRMSPEHLNSNEGRCKKGSINRLLQAFKVHRIRLFGFVRPLLGRKTFLIVEIDPAKKQDKANRRVLSRASDRVVEFEETFGDRNG